MSASYYTKAMETKLLSTSEAAARLGVHPQTLRKWERNGLIPHAIRTPGGRRRYDAAQIAEMLVAKLSTDHSKEPTT